MTDLVEFIEARLAEDERVARGATSGPWRVADVTDYGSATVNGPDAMQDGGYDPATGDRRQVMRPLMVIPPDVDYGPLVDLADAAHIARHDPARALREVEAKRRTMALHAPHRHGACPTCWRVTSRSSAREDFPCPTLRTMASVWSDHPNYRTEWSPT